MADDVGNTFLYREIKVLARHACAHEISHDKKEIETYTYPWRAFQL